MSPSTHRPIEERRKIILAILAENEFHPIESFKLNPSEETFYRARTKKALQKLERDTSYFKAYYALPVAKPFRPVALISVTIAALAISLAAYLIWNTPEGTRFSPLLTACGTVAVIALGWALVGSMTHHYNVRQNTINLLFARFSQQPFSDALSRFHSQFGTDPDDIITTADLRRLKDSTDEDHKKAASSAIYLLNYFEFISSGVLCGDLDPHIITDNIRGLVCYYHDRCEPYIREAFKTNGKTYANLIKLRTHYREI